MSQTCNRIYLVTDEQDFDSLRSDWNELVTRTGDKSVFLRHEWFDAAFQWCKFGSTLFVICVRRNDRLIGVLPLISMRARRMALEYTKLEYLAVPDTQVCDIIVAEGDERLVCDSVLSYLDHNRRFWDVLVLEKLTEDSRLYLYLPDSVRKGGYNCDLQKNGCNYGIVLDKTWSEYYSGRTRRLKKGNNNIANKIKRANLQEHIKWYSNHDDFTSGNDEVLDSIITLSSKSWKNATGLTLDNPGPNAFIKRLTSNALDNDWLSVFVLYFGARPVAAEYQLNYGGVISALRADYDNDEQGYSPGTYLNWRLLEELFSANYKYYSMGPGSNEYKLRWSDSEVHQYKMNIYGKNPKARMLQMIDMTIYPILRAVYNRMKQYMRRLPPDSDRTTDKNQLDSR